MKEEQLDIFGNWTDTKYIHLEEKCNIKYKSSLRNGFNYKNCPKVKKDKFINNNIDKNLYLEKWVKENDK